MGTKWRLADCIKEASKFQVASLQVATLNRLAVCEFEECDYVEKLTFLAVLWNNFRNCSGIVPEFFRNFSAEFFRKSTAIFPEISE